MRKPVRELLELKLNSAVWRLSPADPDDARELGRALNHLGYFTPDPQTGFIPAHPEGLLFEALQKFQRDHELFPSGGVRPLDETILAINAALKENAASDRAYIWRTVGDGKVRSAHAGREGRIYRWDERLEGGHPGEDYNCRCWAEPYFTAYQAPAASPPVPQRKPPLEEMYPDAVNPAISPFDVLSLGGRTALQMSVKGLRIFKSISQKRSKQNDDLTDHGRMRLKQRNISDAEKNEAIRTAKATGKYTTKTGKYGTPQIHYEGENGVNVIVETSGRNAGKVITSWRR